MTLTLLSQVENPGVLFAAAEGKSAVLEVHTRECTKEAYQGTEGRRHMHSLTPH